MLRTLDDRSAEGRAASTARRAGPDERVQTALVPAAVFDGTLTMRSECLDR
jgi:hypothetical protein